MKPDGKYDQTRRAWRVNDFVAALGIGRTKFYSMVGAGNIKTIKFGGRTLVPNTEMDRLLEEAEVSTDIKSATTNSTPKKKQLDGHQILNREG